MTTVYSWKEKDGELQKLLADKGLELLSFCDGQFFTQLRERGEGLFGAELLVIDGTKQNNSD